MDSFYALCTKNVYINIVINGCYNELVKQLERVTFEAVQTMQSVQRNLIMTENYDIYLENQSTDMC